MGWTEQVANLVIIETGSGFTGLFIYEPSPGANNLLASISGLTGTSAATSTPYVIGSNAVPGGGGTTMAITVTTAPAIGQTIQVSADSVSGGPAVTGIIDDAGNPYTSRQAGGTLPGSIWTAPVSAVPATITLTYATSAGAKAAAAIGLPNLASSALDRVPTFTQASSAAPSITTGALAQSTEVVLATICNANAGGAPTWGPGWTPLITVHRPASSDQFLSVAYKNVTTTAPVTAAGTITSAQWTMLAATFKESTGAPGTDPYGNQVIGGGAAFYQLPDSTKELTFIGPTGYQMRSGRADEGRYAQIVQSVNGSSQIVMDMQGFGKNDAGFTDYAGVRVVSNDGTGVVPAQVQLAYTTATAVSTVMATVDYAGLNAIGLGTAADPTVATSELQAAQAETWKSLGTITATGFTASFGQYHLTFEGELEVDVLLTANAGGGTAGTYTWSVTLAAVYRPPTTRIYALGFNATLASGVSNALIVTSAGAVQVKLGALPAATIVGTTVRVPLNI